MNKYDIQYFRCSQCGFVQTEEPFWLEEAYSSAIGDSDVGLAARNYTLKEIIPAILKICFNNTTINHLDFGGGMAFLPG